jgi:hypothetical protein
MTYRWSRRLIDAPGSVRLDASKSGESVDEDDMASYCRVDIIEPEFELWRLGEESGTVRIAETDHTDRGKNLAKTAVMEGAMPVHVKMYTRSVPCL